VQHFGVEPPVPELKLINEYVLPGGGVLKQAKDDFPFLEQFVDEQ
jgi:hypothetical protein